jgi:ABC-type bacteriocin/lantibiotic exporter with double-glycine peptidase domain
MIRAMEKKENNDELNGLTVLFIFMTIITCVFTFFRAYAYNLLGERITLTLRNELF